MQNHCDNVIWTSKGILVNPHLLKFSPPPAPPHYKKMNLMNMGI